MAAIRQFVLLSVASGILSLAGTGKAAVTVKQTKYEVTRTMFDHEHPPDVPGLTNDDGAVTVAGYDFQMGMSYLPGDPQHLTTGKWREYVRITGVNLTVGLKVTIYLPNNAPEKLKAHEDGHWNLARGVYTTRAQKAAKEAGALIDGKRIIVDADSPRELEAAVARALSEAQKNVVDSYVEHTTRVGARISDSYDEITAHGIRDDIDEKTAEAKAIAKEEAAESAAQTKPATGPAATPWRP